MSLELHDSYEAWSLALEERKLALDERDKIGQELLPAARRAIRVAFCLILVNIGLLVANLALWR